MSPIVEAEFYFFPYIFNLLLSGFIINGSDQRATGKQDKCEIQAKAKEKKAETFWVPILLPQQPRK